MGAKFKHRPAGGRCLVSIASTVDENTTDENATSENITDKNTNESTNKGIKGKTINEGNTLKTVTIKTR